MSLLRNPQMYISTSSSVTTPPNRRRSSSSKVAANLNKSYYISQTPSNDSSISSCDSNSFKATSYVESDLLETNIKEIEYTLLGLMDNEAAAASRNSQRLASISNVRNKLYSGESSGRRGRLGSINKNRKNSTNSNMNSEIFQDILSSSGSDQNQQQLFQQTSKACNKENVNPAGPAATKHSNHNESIFLDTPPYFSSPESKSRHQYSSYRNVQPGHNQINHLNTHTPMLNSSYPNNLSTNSLVDHSSPRIYPNYEFLNSPKLSPSPTPYRKKNGEIIMVKTPCYYENSYNNLNSDQGSYMSGHVGDGSLKSSSKQHSNFNNYTNYPDAGNFCSPQQYNKSDMSFHSPITGNSSMDCFNRSNPSLNIHSNTNNSGSSSNGSGKKSVKMSVPSNKRQILEEEFRKEKYPCNEKLQKLSNRLNMKYEEVQRYFKKRRTEEKETNNKFSNLVKLLNNYLETEE